MSDAISKPHDQCLNISKKYGAHLVLDGVHASVGKGRFLTILGPSGCGKTTLLRIIAGLEEPDAGLVRINGQNVTMLSPAKRGVGIVFQSYALFPNLTARENVAYALKHSLKRPKFFGARVDDLLNLVGLGSHTDHYPAQLSGGQQQRVALARALALSPQLLLLDEPLSALDAKVRVHLRGEIKKLVNEMGITGIMVTHDQEEALSMSDLVAVMNKGRIIQCASPAELYEKPKDGFVASFIGSMNFISEAARKERGVFATELCAQSSLFSHNDHLPLNAPPLLGIRPEHIELMDRANVNGNCFRARLTGLEYRGSYYRVGLELSTGLKNISLAADWSAPLVLEKDLRVSSPVDIRLPPEHLHAFDKRDQ